MRRAARAGRWGVGLVLAAAGLGIGWCWSWGDPGPRGRWTVALPPEGRLLGYSPDGRSFATTQEGQEMASWDLATGRRREGPGGTWLHLATTAPDGSHAVGVRLGPGAARALVDLDLATGTARASWPIPPRPLGGIGFLAWGDDDRTFRTFAHRYLGGAVEVGTWDLATGAVGYRAAAGPGLPHVGPVAFAPDGLTWAYYDRAGDAWQLWDGRADRPIHGPLQGPPPRRDPKSSNSPAARFAPDGRTLLTSTDRGAVEVWDVASGRLIRSIPVHPPGHLIYQLDLSPDGRRLASSGAVPHDLSFPSQVNWLVSRAVTGNRRLHMSQEVVIVDLETGRPLARYPVAQFGGFAPDGRTVVTFDTRSTLAIRDAPFPAAPAPATPGRPGR